MPSRGVLIGFVAAIAVLASSTAAFAQKKRDISGTVVDASGAPVEGAIVAVADAATPNNASTDADGNFKLSVPVVNLALTISADGYQPTQVEVIGAKTALQLQVVLAKPPPPAKDEARVVSGLVVDGDRNPIAGATVVIVQEHPVTVLTDEDGTFSAAGVITSDVAVQVMWNGQQTTVDVPAGKGGVVVTIGQPSEGGGEHPPEASSRTLKGSVIESNTGDPVIGATIIVTGTPYSAITDENGAFEITDVPMGELPVEISAYGHETKVVNLSHDQILLDVTLALSEGEQIVIEGRAPVIVKQNLANGASVVSDKELNQVSAPTLDAALQGKLAGANLQFNSGAPGGGAQLRLRGISTINGQSSPLFVIDGVVISNVNIQSGANVLTQAAAGGSGQANQDNPVDRISDLNPNDIESVEVLKGASAAALYGSKAANGVVIITTKRGHNGATAVSVTQRIGSAMVSNKLGSRKFTSQQEVEDTFGNPALTAAYMESGGKAFDHEGEIERTTLSEETIGSVSGGTDKANYYGSLLIKDEPGVVIGTYYEKQTGRIALGYDLWNRVKVAVTANLIHSRSDRGLTNNDNAGVSNYVVLSGTPSFVNLQPTDGVYPVNPAVGSGTNPMQTVALFDNTEDVWRLISGANVQVDAWKTDDGVHQVKILGNFGVDSFNQKNNILSPPELFFEPTVDGLPGTSIDATSTNLNFNLGAGALWQMTPKDGKFKNALSAGLTYESVDLSTVYVVAQDLTAGQPNVDNGASINVSQTRLRTRDAGIYAQEEVALLDDQLSILAGLLGERSSLNGNPDHYFVYPKLAAVYDLTKYVPKDKFDLVRVRAAYGQAGNRPNYGQKFTALTGTNTIDGNSGLQLGLNSGDANIQPERQQEAELGVDAASKNQRAVVEATAYGRWIDNLLLQRSLPTSSGFTTEFFNGGRMRNLGVELAAQVTPIDKTVSWTTRATFTLNRSKVLSLPEGIPYFDITAAGFGTGLGAFRIEPGHSATQIVTEKNGEEVVVGNGEPDFRVGWSNEV